MLGWGLEWGGWLIDWVDVLHTIMHATGCVRCPRIEHRWSPCNAQVLGRGWEWDWGYWLIDWLVEFVIPSAQYQLLFDRTRRDASILAPTSVKRRPAAIVPWSLYVNNFSFVVEQWHLSSISIYAMRPQNMQSIRLPHSKWRIHGAVYDVFGSFDRIMQWLVKVFLASEWPPTSFYDGKF